MVEKYLTEDEIRSCIAAGIASKSMEKDAAWPLLSEIKTALKAIAGGASGLLEGGVNLGKDYVQALMWLGGAGAATGLAGGTAYNLMKERMQREDPEESFNNRLEAMYVNRKRELEDSRWMTRVRSMRDNLKRNYKKMTPDEYRTEYNALVDALDERKA